MGFRNIASPVHKFAWQTKGKIDKKGGRALGETFDYAIKMHNIRKTFGKVVANNNINLELKKGEILALLGENGSGKTTLMNMMSGSLLFSVPD